MKIITYGCSLNQADSETIKGVLAEEGLDCEDAVVVNTCTVKTPTENKILRKLRELEKTGKTVVVAGCIPAARKAITDEFPRFSFIGTNTKDVAEAVKAAISGKRYLNISEDGDKTTLPCVSENNVIGIIPISAGCLGSCSYCQTKHARGNLKSYPQKNIISKIKRHLDDGAKEIWLTSQDNGAYGLDKGTNLARLLETVADIPGDYMVRVGMMNPDHALNIVDELVQSFKHERIYKFAHLPVQSGDDQVLKDMNRGYDTKEFQQVVKEFEKIKATISTDVIVGYPTEDECAFQNTIKLMNRIKPDILNMTRYWARPATPATKLKQHHGRETKRRSRMMDEVFQKIGAEKNKKWVGWRGKALTSKINPDGTKTMRNSGYKPIIVKGGALGEWSDVEVKTATYYDLRGKITQ